MFVSYLAITKQAVFARFRPIQNSIYFFPKRNDKNTTSFAAEIAPISCLEPDTAFYRRIRHDPLLATDRWIANISLGRYKVRFPKG